MDVKYAFCDELIMATKSVDDINLKLVWNNFFALQEQKDPKFQKLEEQVELKKDCLQATIPLQCRIPRIPKVASSAPNPNTAAGSAASTMSNRAGDRDQVNTAAAGSAAPVEADPRSSTKRSYASALGGRSSGGCPTSTSGMGVIPISLGQATKTDRELTLICRQRWA